MPTLTGTISIINISGGDVTVRRDVDEAFRILAVIGGATTVTIEGLTISNGLVSTDSTAYGGGIFAGGGANLTIRNSTISENRIHSSSLGGFGGGIYVEGTNSRLVLESSTVAHNVSEGVTNTFGGIHINAAGGADITNSTIVHNRVTILSGSSYTGMGGGYSCGRNRTRECHQ